MTHQLALTDIKERSYFLQQALPFDKLSPTELSQIAKDFRPFHYEKQEKILRQDREGQRLYVIFQGKVRVFASSRLDRETAVSLYATHDVIGEFSIIDGQPRSATIQALEDCILLEMPAHTFRQHMEQIPNLTLGMCRLLVKKLRWTTAYAQAMAQFDVPGRLLYLILFYNQRFGQSTPDGQHILNLSLRQSELATLVGSSREWTSKTLNEWQKQGLLHYQSGHITILDHASLQTLFQQTVGVPFDTLL